MAKKFQKVDFDAEAAKLDQVSADWVDSDTEISLEAVLRGRLKKIETTPEVRLAIYMKYSFGACLHGTTNKEWIETAQNMIKILGGK